MPCCGEKRHHIPQTQGKNQTTPKVPQPRFSIVLEYTGQSTLIAIGPVSGRRYRFEGSGARLSIDPRDRVGLASIPKLRPVE